MDVNEQWMLVDLPTKYEYYISNLGNVRRRSYDKRRRTGEFIPVPIFITNKGYGVIPITVNNRRVNQSIHRLVATAFIKNPDNKPEVNHINHIRSDNRALNLEWVTHKENMSHAKTNPTALNRWRRQISEYRHLAHEANKKIWVDIQTGVYLISMKELEEYLGKSHNSTRYMTRYNKLPKNIILA